MFGSGLKTIFTSTVLAGCFCLMVCFNGFFFSAGAGALVEGLGTLIVLLLRGKWKSCYLLLLPVVAFINLLYLPEGQTWRMNFLDNPLIFCRTDRLSLVFGYVFVLITFIGMIYALHVKETAQHVAALCYAGGTLGATFAGDLFSLYFFWEIIGLGSVLLIMAHKTDASRSAAFRYFMWHFFGGIYLLAGIILYVSTRGTTQFDYIG